MNAARYFMRREDYQPRQTPAGSPFRRFDVTCLHCGSYDLRFVAQTDEEAGEMAVVLVCKNAGSRKSCLSITGDGSVTGKSGRCRPRGRASSLLCAVMYFSHDLAGSAKRGGRSGRFRHNQIPAEAARAPIGN